MIHSGIIIVYTYGILPPSSAEASVGYGGGERYYTVFSGKLLVIMTSCHGECCLQCKSLNHQIIATASFATDSIIIIQTKARTYKH